jgi:hypothetical protein
MIPMKYAVEPVPRSEVARFIEQWHYSGSINGCKVSYCFAMYDGLTMVGAMLYGEMAMANQWKRFADCVEDVIELRRLCCIDDTPKNTESFFIGWTLRWLKKNTKVKVVVSYADAEYGHLGTIYKASNFTLDGKRAGAKVILWNGKRYHDKAIRTKYKGQLKPFAKRLTQALEDGEAQYAKTAGKYCYVYRLQKEGK